MSDAALTAVLRLSARLHNSAADHQRLADAAAGLSDWHDFPAEADKHGLAPLAAFNLAHAGVSLPIEIARQMTGLTLHHRRTNEVRFRVLGEILDALDRAAVPVIVLKGAALAHVLYPSVGLRPLSDIDLLVSPEIAGRAQAVLETVGFVAPPAPESRTMVDHHHLPGATRFVDGCDVTVEIHRNAFSPDTPGSLSVADLSGPLQEFSVEGRTARALGHADMLFHLCRHAAECAPRLRLVWVADVVGYAARYREVIRWDDVRRRYPFVINALSLLHLVTALPDELLEYVTPARAGGLRGIGVTCRPLSEITESRRPVRDVVHELFNPSDWWLRLYYGLGDDAPLWWHRRVTHPARVAYWLGRRAGTSMRWWASGVRRT